MCPPRAPTPRAALSPRARSHGPGPAGTVAAVSGGGPVSSEGDTTGADRMHTHMGEVPEAEPHMNTHTSEMTEVEQPKRKKQRWGGNRGRTGWARDHDHG